MKVYVSCVVAYVLFKTAICEIYTSMEDVQRLLYTQKSVIESLEKFVTAEEKRLSILNGYLKIFKEEQKLAENDKEYLHNPINAFTLIKRLSADYDFLKMVASIGTDYEWDSKLLYPSNKDMTGAALGVARVQDAYNLLVRRLSQGKMTAKIGMKSVVKKFNPLTASDCFNLGVSLVKEEDYEVALPWLMEALQKYANEDKRYNPFSATDIMTYIFNCYHYTNKTREASVWAANIRKVNPRAASENPILNYYRHGIPDYQVMRDAVGGETGEKKRKSLKTWRFYGEMCRSEIEMADAVARKLHCYYLKRTPFLRLAPIKTEELLKDPDIFLYHDVVSDEEIRYLIESYRYKIKRALVHTNQTRVATEARISKSFWIQDQVDAVVARISRRISDFTSLDVTHAEALQLANYGIGGLYQPHYDFDRTRKDHVAIGNRIATVLIYLTDVELGGATAFLKYGLSVRPQKGTALFWHNLHSSGRENNKTLHAACPVLVGSKWVANKWIHELGQELILQCPLHEPEYPSDISLDVNTIKFVEKE